eukprot:9136271-Prorocentrum_lima.AAC.1
MGPLRVTRQQTQLLTVLPTTTHKAARLRPVSAISRNLACSARRLRLLRAIRTVTPTATYNTRA